MNKDYILFALNSMKSRRLRSWLTMLGIFIGIAAVVALIGLGEGLRTAVVSQFGFLGSDVLSVQASGIDFAGPPGQAVSKPLTTDLGDKIERIRGVEVSIDRYIETGALEFNDPQQVTFVGSVPEGEQRKTFYMMLNLKTADGRLLDDGDDRRVLLGYDYTSSDIFGKPAEAGSRVIVNGKEFEVAGILEKKGSFIYDQSVFMNEKPLLDMFDGNVDVIAVKVKELSDVERVKEEIEQLLRKERDVKKGEEDFRVQSPQALLESLDSTLFAVQLFVSVIASISLLVGGVGIMNTMYTAVLERTLEIGIMKSIGAKNSTIFTLFFVEAGLLGSEGGVIGVLLGLLFAYGFAALGRVALGSDLIQANVGIGLIIGSLLFSFVLGTIAGVLPSFQASRLQPVDALRERK